MDWVDHSNQHLKVIDAWIICDSTSLWTTAENHHECETLVRVCKVEPTLRMNLVPSHRWYCFFQWLNCQTSELNGIHPPGWFHQRGAIPNKDRPLVDRYAAKNGFGKLANDQKQLLEVCCLSCESDQRWEASLPSQLLLLLRCWSHYPRRLSSSVDPGGFLLQRKKDRSNFVNQAPHCSKVITGLHRPPGNSARKKLVSRRFKSPHPGWKVGRSLNLRSITTMSTACSTNQPFVD